MCSVVSCGGNQEGLCTGAQAAPRAPGIWHGSTGLGRILSRAPDLPPAWAGPTLPAEGSPRGKEGVPALGNTGLGLHGGAWGFGLLHPTGSTLSWGTPATNVAPGMCQGTAARPVLNEAHEHPRHCKGSFWGGPQTPAAPRG